MLFLNRIFRFTSTIFFIVESSVRYHILFSIDLFVISLSLTNIFTLKHFFLYSIFQTTNKRKLKTIRNIDKHLCAYVSLTAYQFRVVSAQRNIKCTGFRKCF